MSGIFGIYHPDNRPINSAHLHKMASSIAHRGPDGTKTIQKAHIGFGHSMLRTTPESLNEQLPFNDPESGLVITADARIDNRQDLASKLGIHTISGIPDSKLILYAFKKWGMGSFVYLIGDFAFAIWEPKKQHLICARDYIGVKPFYYHHTPSQFLFSSEIKQLAEHSDVPLTVNEGMVGEYLTFSFCSRTETLFNNISRLSPGHYLVIKNGKKTSYKYWSFSPKKRIYYKNTSQYTDHFLEILEETVDCRLRSNSPVVAELSGGLDSSSVTGMASKLLHEKNNTKLHTYSLTFPGLECDERSYIDTVNKYFNTSEHIIPYNDIYTNTWNDHTKLTFEPADSPNLTVTDPLIRAVKQSHSNVILSGLGADECFTGSGYPYLDYLQLGKVLEFFLELHFHNKQGMKRCLKKIAVNFAWPLVPHSIRNTLIGSLKKKQIPEWLSSDFVDRIQLIRRLQKSDPRIKLSNLARLSHANSFGPCQQFFLETLDRHRAWRQIESRHPFLDQRMVDFALSLPDYVVQKQGQIKYLLRMPSNTTLPEQIRARKEKAEFSYLFNQNFQQTLCTLNGQQTSLLKMGWIDKNKFNKAISAKTNMISASPYTSGYKTWELWLAFTINLWHNKLVKKGFL